MTNPVAAPCVMTGMIDPEPPENEDADLVPTEDQGEADEDSAAHPT